MRIAVGTDHQGYNYKERIKAYLTERGDEEVDFGTYSAQRCDYPDLVRPTAEAVATGDCDHAIVLGASGNAQTMAANKIPRIRKIKRPCAQHNSGIRNQQEIKLE